MRPNDVESILLTKGFWRIGVEPGDQHSGRRLTGSVRAIVLDGPTMPTSHPGSFEKPLRNSPSCKTLHPFIARHTAGFTCDLSGKTDLETVSNLGILDENGLAESRRWSDILNNQNKQDDVQLTGDEDCLSKLSVVFLYYNKSRLGPYSRNAETPKRRNVQPVCRESFHQDAGKDDGDGDKRTLETGFINQPETV